ncbi:hypothetical protein [Allorhizocola rhizosphaerae]|uniref:hypothetical protein n=1 Tax=Allorhizocola rhizosphaerae TaxID=1872709 RepID=UPI000E3D13CA|nr:hypothetical protein [Allorhizocola rhizosphaerae]
MSLKLARVALFTVIPAELLLVVLLVAGVRPPAPVLVAVEMAVLGVALFEAVVAYRMFRALRSDGAPSGAALRGVVERMVPRQVRQLVGFEIRAMPSFVWWIGRRRHGVPPGAVPVSYAKAQTPTMLAFVAVLVLETIGMEVLLRAIGAPLGVRIVVLVLDGYTIVLLLAIIAACVTRPHVISGAEVRLRYGVFFDLRIPRERIVAVRPVRNYNEQRTIDVDDAQLAIAVGSQTNLLIELDRPVTAMRPLGATARVRTIRFFADDPDTAHRALREPSPAPGGLTVTP